MIYYHITIYDNNDPIRALEFEFPNRSEASNFVKDVFFSAGFDVAVTIERRDKPKTTMVYDACTGERKELQI